MLTLLDSQAKAINKINHYKVGALFMRPGTGKTLTAWELVKSVPDVDYILWLTPFQNKENQRTMHAEYGSMDIPVEIVGIETLSASDRKYLELIATLEKCSNPFIVIDESLKIKNWEAKRTKRIIALGKYAKYKLILNGTPISRNLLDLWAQMWFLSPKILNMDIAEFKNTFCEWTKITKRVGRQTITREFITKYHNVDYLYSLIGHYVFEADLELNIRKQYIDINYNVEDEMRDEYERLKAKFLDDENLKWRNNNIFLEMTQKMQHLYSCAEDKFTVVSEIIKNNDPAKCVIFTKYIDSFNECKKRFPNVEILSIQKHSLGLNLQHFNRSIIWDKTWDFALIDQMEHRTYRTGQKEDCVYYHLNGNVGLEDLITSCVNKKVDLLEYLKNKSINELKKVL